MNHKKTITDAMQERYSCRSYEKRMLDGEIIGSLQEYASKPGEGPFGSRARFSIIAAREDDSDALKDLGTYGMIKNPAGFIVGATEKGPGHLEDFGYLMEKVLLYATAQGLGTCWLGGTFSKSSFAGRISLRNEEMVPAVAALGYRAGRATMRERITRAGAGSKNRKPWDELFFCNDHGSAGPLSREAAGEYAPVLDMVRIGPSASNKQPWRIVKEADEDLFHFFLQRTRSYTINLKLLGLADLQRIDMGIAMSHFELTSRELGLKGSWTGSVLDTERKTGPGQYIMTWRGNKA